MVTDHLTNNEVAAFVSGALQGETLRSLAAHIDACDRCSVAVMNFGAAEALRPDDEHLTYRELEGYPDNRLDEETKAFVESHIQDCAACAKQMRAFAALRDEMAGLPRLTPETLGETRPTAYNFVPLLAFGAACLLFCLMFVPHFLRRGPTQQQTETFNFACKEGAALNSGLVMTEMIGRGASSPITSLSPSGTSVLAQTPTLTWSVYSSYPACATYDITVWDNITQETVAKMTVTQPSWTATPPLARGDTYRWTVSGHPAGSPLPTTPQSALFRVVDDVNANAIAAAGQKYGNPSFELAMAYAKAGLVDEGKRVMGALERTR